MFAVGTSAVNAGQDDIVVTETTLAGEAAAAEGLMVETVLNEDRQLYWRTTHAVSTEPNAVTEFKFYQSRQDTGYEGGYQEVYFSTGGADFGMSGSIDLEDRLNEYLYGGSTELLLPVIDLAERTAAGETKTEVMQLNRYYDYYPVALDASWVASEHTAGVQRVHAEQLTDYLRIPVPDNDYIEVTVTKDVSGQVVEVSCNSYETEGETAYTYGNTVVAGDAIYLLLRGSHDYSQIKGGYGLLRIPISYITKYGNLYYEEPEAYLNMTEIENVYPLDTGMSEKFLLKEGMDDSELLLFEQTDDGVILRVLDTADFTVRQEMKLNREEEPCVWYHEDLLIMGDANYGKADGTLQVLRRINGQYSLWLETTFYPLNDTQTIYSDLTFVFDGTRFAMADFSNVYTCGSHRVTVYDETGLVYAGDYHYSSDDLTEPIYTFNYDEPLRLSWQQS